MTNEWFDADYATVPVALSVPRSMPDAVCDDLLRHLSILVETDCPSLGLEQVTEIRRGEHSPDGTIWLTAGGRPVAVHTEVAAEPTNLGWAADTSRKMRLAAQSRFGLFLTAPERSRYANALQSLVDDDRDDVYLDIPGRLLDIGISLKRIGSIPSRAHIAGAAVQATAAAISEVITNALVEPRLSLHLPFDIVQQAFESHSPRMPNARASIYESVGVEFPDIDIAFVDASETVRIRVNDVWFDTGLGYQAGWNEVAAAVKSVVEPRADWFITADEVSLQRSRLSAAVKSLIELSRATYPDVVIAAYLRALVRSGQTIRNLQRMLWLLHDSIDNPQSDSIGFCSPAADLAVDPRDDPEKLAARVRARIADEAWRVGATTRFRPCWALKAQDAIALHSGHTDRRAQAERQIVAAFGAAPPGALAIAPEADLIAPLRYALGSLKSPPRVISIQELPMDSEIIDVALPSDPLAI